ncbi:MAG TPA: ECF-type sigma factor [Pyrinomonadaceae bacterium]|nr:ECF-type sigma factor [Pyrinomonadaceae bacterium]
MQMHEITELLHAWKNGDDQARDRLMELVDPVLKKIAHNYMRNERPGNILQTTALVNEALMRLIKENLRPEDRNQFYGFLRKRMREVLYDYARAAGAIKRGERPQQVDLAEAENVSEEKSLDLIMLDEALAELAKESERQLAVIEYRFFIGLSIDETAEVMGIAPRTVQRDWDYAQAWLKRYMNTSDL